MWKNEELQGRQQQQQQQQRRQPMRAETEEKDSVEELLPLESSPYVKYKDLEEYKAKGYGVEGHLQPKPNHGGGTDAPTLSGSGFPEVAPVAIDIITRQGLIP